MKFRWLLAATVALGVVAPALAQDDEIDELPAISRAVVQALPSDNGSVRLNAALTRLAANPRDVSALLEAGAAAMILGDTEAALGFYGRADQLYPGDPRVKAALASAMVHSEDPFSAIPLFDAAERAGASATQLAADRGLAYDLVGDNVTAQRHYRQALAAAPGNDEIARRLALSLAIAGDKKASEAALNAQLRRNEPSAWRTRAFSLAILGETEEAVKIANGTMPRALADAMVPYLRYMGRLTAAQQAAAANFGHFPRAAQIGRDDPRVARYAALNPRKPVAAAAAPASATARNAPGAKLTRAQQREQERQARAAQKAAAKLAKASPPAAVATTPAVAAAPPRAASTPVRVAAATPNPGLSTRLGPVAAPPQRATPTPTPTPAATQAATSASLAPPRATAVPPPFATLPAKVAAAPNPTPAATTAVPVAATPTPAAIAPDASVADAAVGPIGLPRSMPGAVAYTLPASPAAAGSAPAAPVAATPAPASALAQVAQGTVAPAPARTDLAAMFSDFTPPDAERAAPAVDLAAIERARAKRAAAAQVDERGALPDAPKDTRRIASAEPVASAAARKAGDAKNAKATDKTAKDKAAKPAVPAHPSRIWVQIGVGRDKKALAFDWRKYQRVEAALFKGKEGWTTPWGQTNRLLAGPFDTQAAAQVFLKGVKKNDMDAFVWTSPAGQAIDRLAAK